MLRDRAPSTFEDPLPPAFYPVSLNLVGRKCVIIGDDHEAIEKEEALREVLADVHIFRDASTLQDSDVIDAFFVISTPQDAVLSQRLRTLSDTHKFMLCTIDQPTFGFVAMQAIVKAGPARVAISTGGVAPRVGKHLKHAIARVFDAKFKRFLDCLATQKLRNRYRLADDPRARRAAMIKSADGFEVDIAFRYPQWFESREKLVHPHVLEAAPE